MHFKCICLREKFSFLRKFQTNFCMFSIYNFPKNKTKIMKKLVKFLLKVADSARKIKVRYIFGSLFYSLCKSRFLRGVCPLLDKFRSLFHNQIYRIISLHISYTCIIFPSFTWWKKMCANYNCWIARILSQFMHPPPLPSMNTSCLYSYSTP